MRKILAFTFELFAALLLLIADACDGAFRVITVKRRKPNG